MRTTVYPNDSCLHCILYRRQIHHAAQNPIELDMAQSDAVEARTLLDLRLGAAFTRMQSLTLQASIGELDGTLVSYGKCVMRNDVYLTSPWYT